MHRTQLLIEEWQYEALKGLSARHQRSISDVVREILMRHLRKPRRAARARLMALKGIGSDPGATGRDHDKVL
jgi:hypothetical protein